LNVFHLSHVLSLGFMTATAILVGEALPIGFALSAHYSLSGYWIGWIIGTALTLIWFAQAGSTYVRQQKTRLVEE